MTIQHKGKPKYHTKLTVLFHLQVNIGTPNVKCGIMGTFSNIIDFLSSVVFIADNFKDESIVCLSLSFVAFVVNNLDTSSCSLLVLWMGSSFSFRVALRKAQEDQFPLES